MSAETASQKISLKVAIVGRPNVGKSTLFNRLLGRRRALVHDEPGVTRDRLEKEALWWIDGKQARVLLTDTGGWGRGEFQEGIRTQVLKALEEADVVLFVVDGQTGVMDEDRDLCAQLRGGGVFKSKRVFLLVNKIDTSAHEEREGEFFELGIEPVLGISSEHNRGIESLKEALLTGVEIPSPEEGAPLMDLDEPTGIPRVAIVGRPNVGKSSIVNVLLEEERMIVSPVAGTTVDAVDSSVLIDGHPFILVDTAGIRRKGKTERGVEVLSVVQARKSLERADIALLVLDGEEGPVDQDGKIANLIEQAGCSVLILLNKWDAIKKNQPKFNPQDAEKRIRATMPFLNYAPVRVVSAHKRLGFEGLGEALRDLIKHREARIDTHDLTEWVRANSRNYNPLGAKFYFVHQIGRRPPAFALHVNDPLKVHPSLKRHLINTMRDRWKFRGSPLRFSYIQRQKRELTK